MPLLTNPYTLLAKHLKLCTHVNLSAADVEVLTSITTKHGFITNITANLINLLATHARLNSFIYTDTLTFNDDIIAALTELERELSRRSSLRSNQRPVNKQNGGGTQGVCAEHSTTTSDKCNESSIINPSREAKKGKGRAKK